MLPGCADRFGCPHLRARALERRAGHGAAGTAPADRIVAEHGLSGRQQRHRALLGCPISTTSASDGASRSGLPAARSTWRPPAGNSPEVAPGNGDRFAPQPGPNPDSRADSPLSHHTHPYQGYPPGPASRRSEQPDLRNGSHQRIAVSESTERFVRSTPPSKVAHWVPAAADRAATRQPRGPPRLPGSPLATAGMSGVPLEAWTL